MAVATALLPHELTTVTSQDQKLLSGITTNYKKMNKKMNEKKPTTTTWCSTLTKKQKKQNKKMSADAAVVGAGKTPLLPAEIEEGNVEYKLKLVDPTPERVEHLTSQLKWRLAEGAGEAIYQIGVTDWGEPQGLEPQELRLSLATLRQMANKLKLSMTVLLMRPGWRPNSKIAQVLIRRRPSEAAAIEVRVSMLGPVHSGKSTTVAVLTTGMSDNGAGLARMHVSRHKHELDNGLTTSVSSHVLGFDEKGGVTTHEDDMPSSVFVDDDWEETLQRTCKAVKFVDLAGHTKYLRSTLQGLTSLTPNYVMITLAADQLASVAGAVKRRQSMQINQVIEESDEEQEQEQVVGSLSSLSSSSSDSACSDDEYVDAEMDLVRLRSRVRLARALGIPFFVVVTKIDTVDTEEGFRGDGEDQDAVKEDAEKMLLTLEDRLRDRVHDVLDVLLGDNEEGRKKSESAKEPQDSLGLLTSDASEKVDKIEAENEEQDAQAVGVDVMLVQDGATDYLTAARAMRASHRRNKGSVSPSSASPHGKLVAPMCVPLFCVSNVTGSNMDVLRRFLNVLPVTDERERERSQPTVFHISTVFHDADETAPVVGGLLTAGTIVAGQDVYVGPVKPPRNSGETNEANDEQNDKAVFVKAEVVSVHTSLSQQSARVCAGQSCGLALRLPESTNAGDVLRRGAVLLCAPPLEGQCVREFDVSVSDVVCFGSLKQSSLGAVSKAKAELVVRVNGHFMCHMTAVQQVVRVVKVEHDEHDCVASLRLRFEKHIEFVKKGTTCMLRNANLVVVSNVVAR